LSKNARSITAFEVIHAIDGPLFITSCVKGTKSCELEPNCTVKEPLARVNESIADVLKSITVYDLVDHETAISRAAAQLHQLVSLSAAI
jgi:DNA-binding IscR family transcriptional regulator